jgi:hypothetical protein
MTMVIIDPSSPGEVLIDAVRSSEPGSTVIVASPENRLYVDAFVALTHDLIDELVASLSPLPLRRSGIRVPQQYPPQVATAAPTVGAPCSQLTVLSAQAVELLRRLPASKTRTSEHMLSVFAAHLVRLGLRHVGVPGICMSWRAEPDEESSPPWFVDYVRSARSEANMLLELCELRASTSLRPLALVVDGACLDSETHTGTQLVVLGVSRALAALRPSAEVSLAVPRSRLSVVADALDGSGVRVVERSSQANGFDVVYRPYQVLRAAEWEWCESAGRRLVVGQLDMIGYNNPAYHPSPALFHRARNLQRAVLRRADAVCYLTEFSRRSAEVECPELDPTRGSVVLCGADVVVGDAQPHADVRDSQPFIAVISATFAHKNRSFALDIFDELCENHGFVGDLVIAGPEPFHGRATDVERDAIERMGPSRASRVRSLGVVSEAQKWWILRHASMVLYPSIVEGFGLVPFESAAVDTPSLSYCGTALAEVLGAGPATISSWSPADWAGAVALCLDDEARRAANVAHVREAVGELSWSRSAELTWAAIDGALARTAMRWPADEGPRLAHILRDSTHRHLSSEARSLALRAGPAVKRRIRDWRPRSG